MSKKEKAFELFNQGKRPKDKEVKSLGLKAKTCYNYFQAWKQSGGALPLKEEEYTPDDGQSGSSLAISDSHTATVMKFQPLVTICPLTPIMMSARFVAERELNWRPDMPWENFLDTCLYHLFKSWGFTLQGYIVDAEVEQAEKGGGSQVTAWWKDYDVDKLALAIAEALIMASPQGQG